MSIKKSNMDRTDNTRIKFSENYTKNYLDTKIKQHDIAKVIVNIFAVI